MLWTELLRQSWPRISARATTSWAARFPGWPEITEERAYEREIQRRLGEPTTLLGRIGRILARPVHWVTELLSAGEYAVANAARALIRAGRGLPAEDPARAFLLGLRAAFVDDPEHEITYLRLLDELGWRPRTASGRFLRGVVGLAASILADPLTYVSFGVSSLGKHIAPTVLKEAAKESGLKLIKPLTRMQWLRAKYARKILPELREKLTRDALEAGMAGLEAEAHVSREIDKALARLILPTEGLTAEEAIRAKGTEVLEAALKALGLKPTKKNLEWMAREGFTKLLDRGGLKVFGHSILATRYLTPRTSGLVGLMLGNAWKHQMPLAYKLAQSVFSSKAWQTIVAKPVRRICDLLRKSFQHYGLLDGEARELLKQATTGQRYLAEQVDSWLATMKLGGTPRSELVLPGSRKKVPLPVVEIAPLKRKEIDLLQRLLVDARHELPDRARLADWIEFKLRPREAGQPHPWLKQLGFGNKTITRQDAEKYAKVLAYWQDALDSIARFERALGIDVVAEEMYFPMLYRSHPKLDPEELRRANYLANRRLDWNWDQLIAQGFKPASFEEAVRSRLLYGLSLALRYDIIEQAIYKFGRHRGAMAAFASELLADEEFIKNYPELAYRLAELARKAEPVHGISQERLQTFKALLRYVRARRLSQDYLASLAERIKNWQPPANISAEDARELEKMIEEAVQDKARFFEESRWPASDWEDFLRLVDTLRTKLYSRTVEAAGAGLRSEIPLQKIKATTLGLVKEARKAGVHRINPYAMVDQLGAELPERLGQMYEEIVRDLSKVPIIPEELAKQRERLVQDMWRYLGYETRKRDLWGKLPERLIGRDPEALAQQISAMRKEGIQLAKEVDEELRRTVEKLKFVREMFAATPRMMRSVGYRLRYQFLVRLKRSLPDPEWLEKSGAELAEHIKRITNLLNRAEKVGARRELHLLISSFFGNKPVWRLNKQEVARLVKLMEEKRPYDPKVAVRLFQKLREETQEKWKALEASNVRVRDPLTGEMVSLEGFALPKTLAEALYGSPLFRKPPEGHPLTRALARGFDWMSSTLAASLTRFFPSFYVRNIGDVITRLLGCVGGGFWDRQTWKEAFATVAGHPMEIKVHGNILTTEDIAQLLRDIGLWHSHYGRVEHSSLIRRWIAKKLEEADSPLIVSFRGWAQDTLSELKKRFPKYKWVTQFDANMENIALAAGAISMLKQGWTVSDIERRLARYLFDYSNLTPFERDWMRRIVLFYSYIRQSIPFGFTAIREARLRWWWVTPWKRIRDMAFQSKEEEAMVPEWIRDYPFIYVRRRKGAEPLVISLRNVFSVDTIFGEWPTLSPHALLRMLNPLVIAAFDLASGTDLYWGRSLKETRYLSQEISRWWQEVPGFKEVGKWLQMRKVKLRDKEVIAVNAHRWYLLRRLWFSRFWRTMDELAKFLDEPDVNRLMYLLTGIKAVEIDIDRQQELIMHDAERFRREYTKALNRQDYIRAKKILEEVRLK